MFAHVLTRNVPDGEQDALSLVVTRPVLVGLSEITQGDRSVDGRDDLGHPDVCGVLGQHIAAADAALRLDQPGSLEGQQDLLQIGLGESRAFGDVPDRGRCARVGVEGERQKGPTGIVATRRNSHGAIVGGGLGV